MEWIFHLLPVGVHAFDAVAGVSEKVYMGNNFTDHADDTFLLPRHDLYIVAAHRSEDARTKSSPKPILLLGHDHLLHPHRLHELFHRLLEHRVQ